MLQPRVVDDDFLAVAGQVEVEEMPAFQEDAAPPTNRSLRYCGPSAAREEADPTRCDLEFQLISGAL